MGGVGTPEENAFTGMNTGGSKRTAPVEGIASQFGVSQPLAAITLHLHHRGVATDLSEQMEQRQQIGTRHDSERLPILRVDDTPGKVYAAGHYMEEAGVQHG